MDKQKVVVILLVIAIVASVISVVMSLSMLSGFQPIPVQVRDRITNIFHETNNSGPDGAGVGLTILKPGSGK